MFKNRKINDSFINQSLITFADAEAIENIYSKSNFRGIIVSTVIGSVIIPLVLFFYEKFDAKDEVPEILLIFILIIVLFLVLLCYYFYLKLNTKGLKECIINISQENADHTGIFLITQKCDANHDGVENDIMLLIENNKAKYITFLDLKNNNLYTNKKEYNENKLKSALSKKFDLGCEFDKINIVHVAQENSIKHSNSCPGNTVKQIRYELFHVFFPPNFEKTIIQSGKYKWERLSNLEKSANEGYNEDVIDYIKTLFSQNKLCRDSFLSDERQLKIIWNIADTEKCKQNCSICATNSSRSSLSKEQKCVALCNLLCKKDIIKEIDFSGGDPLLSWEDREIILNAISVFGKERVWVTTTGEGILTAKKELNDENILKKLLYNCEITLDIDLKKNIRADYNNKHESMLFHKQSIINRYVTNLGINIPIIDADVNKIDKPKIVSLVERIYSIPIENKTVNLIRLMEVGNQGVMGENELNTYNEGLREIVNLFCTHAKTYNLKVKIHCAMRGLVDSNYICNMRDEKIGIDCAGNVFSCAWGGYIKDVGPKENKFYIGNVYEHDLDHIFIIADNGTIRAMDDRYPNSCCVYSYNHSASKDPYDGSDPLFQK